MQMTNSVRRWRKQQQQQQVTPAPNAAAAERQGEAQQQRNGTESAATTTMTTATGVALGGINRNKRQQAQERNAPAVAPSNYVLVVKKSKALVEGRRFELPCGTDVVIGRSQHLAGIVVRDEMVGDGVDWIEMCRHFLCVKTSWLLWGVVCWWVPRPVNCETRSSAWR